MLTTLLFLLTASPEEPPPTVFAQTFTRFDVAGL